MAYTGTSIVDYLKSVGAGSSYADRVKLAAAAGITNYSGTAAQNTQLLAGQQKPAIVTPAVKPVVTNPVVTPAVSKLLTQPGVGAGTGATPMAPNATPISTFSDPKLKPAPTPVNPGNLGGTSGPTSVISKPVVTAPKPAVVSNPGNLGGTSGAGIYSTTAQLQQKLNTMGAGLVVDGVMGPKTAAAQAKYMSGNTAGGTFTASVAGKVAGAPIATGTAIDPKKIQTLQGTPTGGTKTILPGTTTGGTKENLAAPTGASVAKSQTLRDWATANNYEVSFDEATRMVTVKDPATGKTSSFKDNEAGVDSGIGTKVNGQNTITDPAKFAASMKDQAAEVAAAENVDLNDPTQLQEFLAKFVKDYIDTSTEEDLNAGNAAFQQMLTMFGMDTTTVPVPDIMSFGEAKQQAAEMYDPMYADQKDRLTKSMQEASVRSGFAGQLPWQMYEAENQGALERQRTGDIANAANTLVGQSKNDANTALAQGASKRQELFNMFNTAFNTSQANKNGKFDILKNWMDTLGQKTTTDINNVRTGQQNDEYLKYTVPLNEQKVREAATKADIAEIDFALKAAEYSISDETNRLKLQKLRQDISNASSANARAAALNAWQVEAAQMGVAIDAITLDDKSQDIWSKDYNTSKSDFMDKVGMGNTNSTTGDYTPRYDRAGLMAVISGYTGITGAERDRLANMIPSSYQ